MSYTMEDFQRQYAKDHFARLTPEDQAEVFRSLPPEEQAEVLRSLPPEQRLAGLAPEERLAGLSAEQIREYLKRRPGRPPQARKGRRKK